jgi:hypothetical protein
MVAFRKFSAITALCVLVVANGSLLSQVAETQAVYDSTAEVLGVASNRATSGNGRVTIINSGNSVSVSSSAQAGGTSGQSSVTADGSSINGSPAFSITSSSTDNGIAASGSNSGTSPGSAFLGSGSNGKDAFVTTSPAEFYASMSALSISHDAQVQQIVSSIVPGQSRGGMITTFAQGIYGNPPLAQSCIKRPSLTVLEVTRLAQTSFGMTDFTPTTPNCQGGRWAYSQYYGWSCQYEQIGLLTSMYDTGLSFTAIGATDVEAFAPFQHLRDLGYNLRYCDPTLNPPGTITIPHSYAILYDVYNAKLMASLRARGIMSKPTSTQWNNLLDTVWNKRWNAARMDLSNPLVTSSHLPNSYDISIAIRVGIPANANAMVQAIHVVRASATELGLRMSDAACNAFVNPTTYFLQHLSISLVSQYQVCCAQECGTISATTRSLTGNDMNCCVGCNRYSCSPSTPSTGMLLAGSSTITSPAKVGGVPEMVSIMA